MESDYEIYDGKSFSDLCKQIIENSAERKTIITNQINALSELVQNIGDAIAIMPLIHNMIDSGTKNDDTLVKLAGVLNRANSQGQSDGGLPLLLTESEQQALLNAAYSQQLVDNIFKEDMLPIQNNELNSDMNKLDMLNETTVPEKKVRKQKSRSKSNIVE